MNSMIKMTWLTMALIAFALALASAGMLGAVASGSDEVTVLPGDIVVVQNPIDIDLPGDDIVIVDPDDNIVIADPDDILPGLDDHLSNVTNSGTQSLPANITFTKPSAGIGKISRGSSAPVQSAPVLVTSGIGSSGTAIVSVIPESTRTRGAEYTTMVVALIKGSGNDANPTFSFAQPGSSTSMRVSADQFLATTFLGMIIMATAAMVSSQTFENRKIALIGSPLYSRINRDQVLENDTRGSIYKLIAVNPGMDLLSIKNALGLSNGVLAHHIHTLERERYLRSVRDGRYRRFFITGSKIDQVSSIDTQILFEIEGKPSINQSQIARNLGVSRQALNYHIRKLVKKGTIITEKVGRETVCKRRDS
jgi:hypothetical protein